MKKRLFILSPDKISEERLAILSEEYEVITNRGHLTLFELDYISRKEKEHMKYSSYELPSEFEIQQKSFTLRCYSRTGYKALIDTSLLAKPNYQKFNVENKRKKFKA